MPGTQADLCARRAPGQPWHQESTPPHGGCRGTEMPTEPAEPLPLRLWNALLALDNTRPFGQHFFALLSLMQQTSLCIRSNVLPPDMGDCDS